MLRLIFFIYLIVFLQVSFICLMFHKNQLLKRYQKIFFLGINLFIIYSYGNFLVKNYHNKTYNYNSQKFTIINKSLAFGIFLQARLPSLLDIHQVQSQEILITGIDNSELQEKLIAILGIPIRQEKLIAIKNIRKIIYEMKLSGFFTTIDVSYQYINTHQNVYINVSINPILKSVKILDYHEKLITNNYLISLFKKQVGYPINFLALDKSINLLQSWYHSNGYQWAKVSICQSSILDQNITIKISEGLINQIEITGYNKDYYLKRFSQILPISLILETLKVKPDSVLNIKNLENGIVKLKNKKVILHCNYEVIHLSHNRLNLLLNLELLDDRHTYLFSKNVSITSSLLESIELLLQYSVNHLFYNNNCTELAIFNTLYNFTANRINNLFHTIYLNMSEYDKEAYQLLYPETIRQWPSVNEWYLTQLIFAAGDNFGFRHYIRNVGKNNSHYILDVRFPQTGPYVNIKYAQPWIHIYRQIFSECHLRLYKDTYKFHKTFIPVLLDKLNDSIFYYQNSILSHTEISFECKHDISKSISLIENISFKKIVYQYLLLHNSILWSNLNSRVLHTLINSYSSYFKQIWINNIQEFVHFDISIVANKMHNTLNAIEVRLDLNHFIPKKINQVFYRLPTRLNYSNKMHIKLLHRYHIMNNMLHCESELLTLIGRLESLPYAERFLVIGPDIVRGYTEEVFPLPLKFGKVKLEYHIKLASHNTIFVFLDYAKNISYVSKFKNYHLLFSPYSLNKFNEFQEHLGYGIGLQIKIPFKQIPLFRIEHGYNIHHGKCLHLRFDKS